MRITRRPTVYFRFVKRAILGLILTGLILMPPLWGEGASTAEYRARRAELRKPLDGVLVLFGAEEPTDLHDRFFQEPNFFYLTGWQEPGAALVMTGTEEILFLPPRQPHMEAYNGRTTSPEDKDAAEKSGFEKILPRAALETQFLRLIESSAKVFTLNGDATAQKLIRLGALHEARDAADLITRQRIKKSAAEIELIRKATDATVMAHRSVWKQIRPGLFEYQIAAAMADNYEQLGCERSAYAPIVGSGPNSVLLHYAADKRKIEAGDLIVIDAGGEYSGYATDVTRTIPASGKFTARQREIYGIVLAAQKAAIAAVKPGMKLRGDDVASLQKIAMNYINTHGKDLHGEPLGKYYVHGLGHYVGLEVHDPGSYDTPLEAGMVITIEPGIYLPEENLGVRIEDTLLVTATGAEVLSSALPKEAEEIERLIGK
jgi:Xaa-Pro aminopeptidase